MPQQAFKKHEFSYPQVTLVFHCNQRKKILWSIVVDQLIFSKELSSKNVSRNAQWDREREIISHLPPLSSEVLENSNPSCKHCYP